MNVKNFNKSNDLMNHKRQLREECRGSKVLEPESIVERVGTIKSDPVISLVHIRAKSK